MSPEIVRVTPDALSQFWLNIKVSWESAEPHADHFQGRPITPAIDPSLLSDAAGIDDPNQLVSLWVRACLIYVALKSGGLSSRIHNGENLDPSVFAAAAELPITGIEDIRPERLLVALLEKSAKGPE